MMSRFKRAQVETLLGRLREPPQRIIALFGPRQSGKAMIVDQALALFELSSHYSGQIVSFTKLVGHLQDAGNTTTLARYLDLLEETGLVAGLPGYATEPRRRRSSPKLLVLDPALMTAPSRYDFREALADRSFWSRVVASAVGAHLFQTRGRSAGLHYWRYRNADVDFVLERGPHLLAVEVRTGAFRGWPSGLDAFRKRYPRARTLLVGEGGVPLAEFLSKSAEHWLTERSSSTAPSDGSGSKAIRITQSCGVAAAGSR